MKPSHLAIATALVAVLAAMCSPADAQVAGRRAIDVAEVQAAAAGSPAVQLAIGSSGTGASSAPGLHQR